MDVIVKGKVFYQVDNAIAAMLIEAFPESFQRVNPRPAPTPAAFEAKWSIPMTASGYYYVAFSIGQRTEIYDGPPSQLVSTFQKMGIVAPDHIVTRYTPLWKPRDNEHPSVQVAYWAEYEAIHEGNKK